MKKIRKAVIPAAGFGTRVLPASKAVPKEMLNIVDKPAIQYIVEEAVAAGIEDILIITNRGKAVIEDHFDHSFELEHQLEGNAEKEDILAQVKAVSHLANIYFLRQKEAKGLGHAILCAKGFVDDEPFAVLYGDDVIISETPVTSQLIDAYNEFGNGVVGVKEVTKEQIQKYSTLKVETIRDNIMNCTDMIEKPSEDEILSLYSVLGRCILPSEIFDILSSIPNGAGGELQLTDAMKVLAQNQGITAVDFDGKRYDLGNKLGILQANVEVGLKHNEIGEDFKKYLKGIIEELN